MNSLIHIGSLRIPTTGIFSAVGLVLALMLAQRLARYAMVGATALWDAGLMAVLAALFSSRLLLIAFNWETFLAFPKLVLTLPSLTGLGMAIAAVLVAIYLRLKRLPAAQVADAYAAPAMLLWAVFAVGDLAAGNHEGLPTESAFSLYDPLWGRVLPSEPVTALLALAVCAALLWQIARPHAAGAVAARCVGLFGTALFFADFLRAPAPLTTSLLLDPVQWVALICALAGLLAEFLIRRRGPVLTPAPLLAPNAAESPEESLHAL